MRFTVNVLNLMHLTILQYNTQLNSRLIATTSVSIHRSLDADPI
jgi:hypothetical protein